MELHQLRCFVAVVEHSGFTAAAQSLHLTASPVSRTVKALEEELGVDLLVRRHHSVVLTSAGEQLLDGIRDIIARVDELNHLASRIAPGRHDVALGGTHMSPPGALDEVARQIEAQQPKECSLRITLADANSLPDLLEEGRLDVALMHLPIPRGIAARTLATYDLHLAVCAGDPLAEKLAVSWKDVAARTVTISASTPFPSSLNEIRRQLEAAGVHHFDEVDGTDVSLLANRIRYRGGVIPTLPPSVGGPWKVFDDPAYVVLPLEDGAVKFTLGLAWNTQRYRTDRAFATIVDGITLPSAASRPVRPLP